MTLDSVQERLVARVSADQRYKLFVGDQMVSFGPQRGDPDHWFFEEIDLAPFLNPGENWIWALVWNFGWMAPMAQMTLRTGFLFDAPGLSTPGDWEIARVSSWDFGMFDRESAEFYMAIGPGEVWDGRVLGRVLDLPRAALDWRKPHEVQNAVSRGDKYEHYWPLVGRTIPAMRYELRSASPVFRRGFEGDSGGASPVEGAPAGEIVVNPSQPILVDFGELLCAYPRLSLTGSEGATLTVTYAEALWTRDPKDPKGNRDEVAGKRFRGYQDRIVNGPEGAEFEPLWWRTFRYVLLESDAAVKVQLDAVETGYPYQIESSFEADDPCIKPIWDVAVRTAERCAGETYFDCPYYEQLQYAGDTRIQALISYYLGRDRALARNAVEQFGWSIMENGLTQSRYPARVHQIIPPFSLWWCLMGYDQWLYDEGSLGRLNKLVATVTDGIAELQSKPGDAEFWNFTDWVPTWEGGVPPGGVSSAEVVLTELFLKTALLSEANENLQLRQELERFQSGSDGLIRILDGKSFAPSEHVESLYRLVQKALYSHVAPWPTAALEQAGAARATYYFSYYKHIAKEPIDYLTELQPWKEMIEDGLTTFAENPAPVRSDCHAWSAHPILGFFQIVAGVTSIGPNWSKAKIAPNPGSLKRFDARIAHPAGELRVALEDGKLAIDTPVPASLHWQGKMAQLEPGRHVI